ncbi:hypothetical protein Syun_003481 [Stephania yunnanensis]|uniref:WDR11 second beta-propeller domain-containing protein n=1 Tax=Stephania yunnanensis TaxID=152371 RepID=A0AAP0Q1N0_9MAGN
MNGFNDQIKHWIKGEELTLYITHMTPNVTFAWRGDVCEGVSESSANEKAGGYNNKLVVTRVRSGLNRIFRVMQKPERAPIRALRASSSGSYVVAFYSIIVAHASPLILSLHDESLTPQNLYIDLLEKFENVD